jgi:hypothetical protein
MAHGWHINPAHVQQNFRKHSLRSALIP